LTRQAIQVVEDHREKKETKVTLVSRESGVYKVSLVIGVIREKEVLLAMMDCQDLQDQKVTLEHKD
jgi:hypothetical protein